MASHPNTVGQIMRHHSSLIHASSFRNTLFLLVSIPPLPLMILQYTLMRMSPDSIHDPALRRISRDRSVYAIFEGLAKIIEWRSVGLVDWLNIEQEA